MASVAYVSVLGTLAVAGILALVGKYVYLLYFHPLSKYPGPKLAAVSELWYVLAWTSGRYSFVMYDVHAKYGDRVRIGPNKLSLATPQAFRDIYGFPSKTKKLFVKSDFYEDGTGNPSIGWVTDPVYHAKLRRIFTPSFSRTSLREYEPVIHKYTDMFISQIGKLGHPSGQGINIATALNWVTFDIIGELAFGESFNAVADGRPHFWIQTVVEGTYFQLLWSLRSKLSAIKLILPFIVPKDAAAKQAKFAAYTEQKISRRIELQNSDHPRDFFDDVILSGELTEEQVKAQAGIIIIAGSETSATTLSAAIYHLVKYPECRETLTKEIRSSFTSPSEITADAAAQLSYLTGVIKETLRIFSTVPFGLPRISPGEVVDGEYIPKGVEVSSATWQLGHDPRYWKEPWSFKPERWIGKGLGDNTDVYYPFGYGPRNCIGEAVAWMEMRIILAKMIFSYDWEWVNTELDWFKQAKLYLVWDKPALLVKFHPRNHLVT
ncbi:hypothetical protein DL768_004013 [Monosporascus sp. mg162]|nr:hypothetical protein DL768_004013 [Monosporascus sp. mg162]